MNNSYSIKDCKNCARAKTSSCSYTKPIDSKEYHDISIEVAIYGFCSKWKAKKEN